ncbi:unnamed protein product [Paramecium octaurelia]|uniref:Uncharacterized protein n=1 Tax=Paramecium octaurelia TaxID=43137 RepID=A0A8S1X1T6_PAROT|nr:unnamed protein product [Paramecium octaurelia]
MQEYLQYSSKKFQNWLSSTFQITYYWRSFQISNASLDYGIDEKNLNKFKNRVRSLNEILIIFVVNPQNQKLKCKWQRQLWKKQQQVDGKQRKKQFLMKELTIYLQTKAVLKIYLRIYLICGTEDAFIILSYLERNQEKILKEQKKKLREIFEDGVRQYSYTSREVQEEDQECSSICQMI